MQTFLQDYLGQRVELGPAHGKTEQNLPNIDAIILGLNDSISQDMVDDDVAITIGSCW